MESFLQSLGVLPMFILMFAILYFILIRPQLNEQKAKDNMIKNLKKNDKIITNGGLVGNILEFQGKNDQYIIIDNNAGSKIKLLRSAVTSLIDKKS